MTDEDGFRDALNTPAKVLDHGFVRYIDHMGSDEAIVEAARMSTGKGFLGWEAGWVCKRCGQSGLTKDAAAFTESRCAHDFGEHPGDKKLLAFMYSHAHMTPFEFGVLHIEVQAPLFVFREWHRHRMQSYSEASARYTQMPNEHYVPELERFTPKTTGNKQADSVVHPGMAPDSPEAHQHCVRNEQANVYGYYEEMLAHGVPKEVARINTPVSRYSKMRATTDLRNWLAFLTLRDAPSAQWEIQQYAKAVGQIVEALWPRTYALWEEHTQLAVTLSRSERELFTRWHADKLSSDVEFEKLADRIENF